MRLRFQDDPLRRLYTDATFQPKGMSRELARAFRKKAQLLAAVGSAAELRQFKALRLEKLKGGRSHQHSIRLKAVAPDPSVRGR